MAKLKLLCALRQCWQADLWRHRWLHLLGLICASTVLGSLMPNSNSRWPALVDHTALDAYFRIRGGQDPHASASRSPATSNIVLVETDHVLPRRVLAQLLDKLYLAKVVAVDFLLEDHEAELRPAERPYYAADIKNWRAEADLLTRQAHRLHSVALGAWLEAKGDAKEDAAATRQWIWQRPPARIWQAARYHAHLVVNPDEQDGVVRDVSLFEQTTANQPGGNLPCLGLCLAAVDKGLNPQQVAALAARQGYLQLGARRIPLSADGRMLIDYVGDRASFERDGDRINYMSVLDGYPPALFKDKIVIIGEVNRRSKEIMMTPFGEMPALAIHANVVATLLNPQGPPTQLPAWQLLGIIFCGCLLLTLPLRWEAWVGGAMLLLEVVLALLLGAWIFARSHQILPLSGLVCGLLLTFNGTLLYEHRHAWKTLGQFIGSDRLPALKATFSYLQPGSKRERAGALFCDLQGFSRATEELPVEMATAFSNAYVDTVIQVTEQYGGRLIDHAGDGAFVLFERSRLGDNYAMHAVHAAIQLDIAIRQLGRHWFPAQGIQAGLAIEVGEAMVGLIGGARRFKFGAVGKTINIACHAQAHTRPSGYNVLITQGTYDLVKDEIQTQATVRYYDSPLLKGRPQPTSLYGLTDYSPLAHALARQLPTS